MLLMTLAVPRDAFIEGYVAGVRRGVAGFPQRWFFADPNLYEEAKGVAVLDCYAARTAMLEL